MMDTKSSDSRTRENAIIAVLAIAAFVVSGSGLYLSTTRSIPTGNQPQANVVNMDVIPDYGGAGYDAFVLASNVQNGVVPTPATNTTAPGTNDNNVTVSAGTTVEFVLTSIDPSVNQNFTGQVSTPFTVYNDTTSGMVASHYGEGQSISNMPVGHSFAIPQLELNIPLPATTVVTFSVTFPKSGLYMYLCDVPCGPGMGLMGYMEGYVVVK